MSKPQVYINLSQTLAVTGAVALGWHYINVQRDAVGIQKTQFKDRIVNDAKSIAGFFVAPFRHYF